MVINWLMLGLFPIAGIINLSPVSGAKPWDSKKDV